MKIVDIKSIKNIRLVFIDYICKYTNNYKSYIFYEFYIDRFH